MKAKLSNQNIVFIKENKISKISLKGLCIILFVNQPLAKTVISDLADQEQAGSVTVYLSPLKRPVGKCDRSETH